MTLERKQYLEARIRREKKRSFAMVVAGVGSCLAMVTVLTCRASSRNPGDKATILVARRIDGTAVGLPAAFEPLALPAIPSSPTPSSAEDEAASVPDNEDITQLEIEHSSMDAEHARGDQPSPADTPTRINMATATNPATSIDTNPPAEVVESDAAPNPIVAVIRESATAEQRAGWRRLASIAATTAQPGEIVVNTTGIALVLIPGGSVTIPPATRRSVRPARRSLAHLAISNPFWISQTEITRRQWTAVMGDNRWPADKSKQNESLPATGISWDAAVRFCRRLTEIERELDALPAGEAYELPTEGQWEYALRSDTKKSYPAGGPPDTLDYGWFSTNAKTLHPVGEKKPAGWKLFDMQGNAWEWCRDWYSEDVVNGTDPSGPAFGSYRHLFRRVCRGGSFLSGSETTALTSSRAAGLDGEGDIGIRVVRISR